MPELPEVEHLRRTLEPHLVGRRIAAVLLRRRDVVRDEREPSGRRAAQGLAAGLLRGCVIGRLVRHGKQMAIVSEEGPVICVHLGMSGQLRHLGPGERLDDPSHVHCQWRLSAQTGSRGSRLVFRDPRRFGGLWIYGSERDLRERRWSHLGPDALSIRTLALARGLRRTRRAVKSALLDQTLVAGVGNIYADEALFAARVHPEAVAAALADPAVGELARAIRSTLRQAIRGGGSTLRDYVDGDGAAGRHALAHMVYGRAGAPCRRCGRALHRYDVAQRTTVACPHCQSLALE